MASLKQWLISKLPNCKRNQPRKIKVVVLGDSETGKTTLVSAMMGKRLATDNINCHHTRFTYQGVEYRLELVDPESSHYRLYYDNHKRKYFQGADACILTYRTDRKESFEHLGMWREEALKVLSIYDDSNRRQFPFLAVGTYNEPLREEGPSAEEGRLAEHEVDVRRWCAEHNMDYIFVCTQRIYEQIDSGLRYGSSLETDVKKRVMDMVMKEVLRYESFQRWQEEKRRQEQLERERQEEQEREQQQQRSEAVRRRSLSTSQDSPRPVVHEQLQRSTGARNQPSIVPGPERNQLSIIPRSTSGNCRVLAGGSPTRNIRIPSQAPPNRLRELSYEGWSEDTEDSLPGLLSESEARARSRRSNNIVLEVLKFKWDHFV